MNALTSVLQRVDGSAPAIQAAASELMRHYDNNTKIAVLEWRNALFKARTDQILPLLYVANEVLQNSKRNRGTKYLEEFSPILKQSLEYMAEQLPNDVEKIRRTVKIWGDRHTLSIRFINDILGRLEKYRGTGGHNNNNHHHNNDVNNPESIVNLQMSPLHEPKAKDDEIPPPSAPPEKPDGDDQSMDDDILQILAENDDDDDDDKDIDDVAQFGSSEEPKLEIDLNFGEMAVPKSDTTKSSTSHNNHNNSRTKRRRGSGSGRRPSILSSTSMVDLWKQLAVNQQDVELCIKTLKDLHQKAKEDSAIDVAALVGDKLQRAAKLNHTDKLTILKYRRRLFTLANERRDIEQQAMRYYHWIAQSIHTDIGDLDLADTVETKLLMWGKVAERLTLARTVRRERENELRLLQELQQQKEREAAEAAAFRAAALAKETEAKPGMVWNPTTREYQALNTDESWRD
jgi:CID domain